MLKYGLNITKGVDTVNLICKLASQMKLEWLFFVHVVLSTGLLKYPEIFETSKFLKFDAHIFVYH